MATCIQSNYIHHKTIANFTYILLLLPNFQKAQRRDDILFFQPKDLLLFLGGGVMLSPNISLRAGPWSENPISFATMAALSITWFRSVSFQRRWTSWCLLLLEFKFMPHFWYISFLSAPGNFLYMSRQSILLSRLRALRLLNKNDNESY